MDRQSAKRRREDDDGSAKTTDRLSQLPQPVLHQILSLLSQKDAVRTSVLSKLWRYLWHGRLNVEFRDDDICLHKKTEFWSYIDKTLQRYLDQNLSLQKFLLDIHSGVDVVLLKKWIPIVIMNMGVRSLNLMYCSTKDFPLPLVIFQSEFLVELHLQGLNLSKLKFTDNVMLKNLQTLRLHYVYITDEIFEKIILGCPLIESLDMLKCIGMKSIKLHKHYNIKDFGCSVNVPAIVEIEDSHSLESLRIENYCSDWFLSHNNMHFLHLKSLNLYRVQLPAETFCNFSSFFPRLNELSLNFCKGSKEFILLSSSIKRLTIKTDWRNRIKAFIDAPNILYFEYSGEGDLPSIKFMTTSNKWKSKILLWYKLKPSDNDATSWFLKLNKLLKALSQSHITLNLNPKEYKELHINDSLRGFYKPVVVEQLKLRGCFSDPTILNCFFRICHPRYIHMDEYANELVEFICNLIPVEIGCYFWLQDLEEVHIEVRDMEAKEWNCVQRTSLPALPVLNSKQPIRFRLTWREQ